MRLTILFILLAILTFPHTPARATDIKTGYGLSSIRLEKEIKKLSIKGYRLLKLQAYSVNKKIYYATIWSVRSKEPFKLLHGLTAPQLKQENEKQKSAGYMLDYLSGYQVDGNTVYAAIWIRKKGPLKEIHHSLDNAELKKKHKLLHEKGYQLARLSGYVTKAGTRYIADWVQEKKSVQVFEAGITDAAYTAKAVSLEKQGYRLSYISGFSQQGSDRYSAIWTKGKDNDTVAIHRLNSRNLKSALANKYYTGYKLKTLSGYAVGKKAHYVAMWENHGFNKADREHIESTVKTFMDRYQTPGLAVAITKQGRLVYAKGFGLTRKKPALQTSPLHRFRIGSVSKSLTSLAVMKLVQNGQLKLDDKVFGKDAVLGGKFGSGSLSDNVRKITVRHLLEHTVGAAGWNNNNNDGTDDPVFSKPGLTKTELIGWVLDNRPLEKEPGMQYSYSNLGYSILGLIIEKKSGMPYSKYVKKHILRPAGIRRMLIANDLKKKKRSNEAIYYGDRSEDPYILNMKRMEAFAGWIASPVDLARLMVHVDGYNTKKDIISAETVRTMTTGSGANDNYALGWAVNKNNDWRHNGSLPGTYATVVRTNGDYCWAVLTNSRSGREDFGKDFDKLTWDIIAGVKNWPQYDLF
ncbi:MAG: serine hydrolase [Methyloligellaceae bacterium]